MAKDAVVGAIHPHHLRNYFPDIDPGVLSRAEKSPDGDLLGDCHALCPQRTSTLSATLPALPAMRISWNCCRPNLETLQRGFDELRYGRLPDPIPFFGAAQHTDHDAARAPNGHAMFSVYSFAPYDIEKERGVSIGIRCADVWPRQMFSRCAKNGSIISTPSTSSHPKAIHPSISSVHRRASYAATSMARHHSFIR